MKTKTIFVSLLSTVIFMSASGIVTAAASTGYSIAKTASTVKAPSAPRLSFTQPPTLNCIQAPCPVLIGLAWTESSTAASYQLYRNGVLLATFSASADLSYVDQLNEAGTYSYSVKAINSSGSATSNALTYNAKIPPTTPLPVIIPTD